MVRLLLLLTSLFGTNHQEAATPGSPVYNSGGPLMYEQAAYDVLFYDLTLFVNPADSTISGTLRVDAAVTQPLNWLVLDLDPDLEVRSSHLANANPKLQPLRFLRKGGKLWIALPEEAKPGQKVSVEVAYGGRPMIAVPHEQTWSDGFLWTRSKSGEPWLGTISALNGADIWWPCKDHPSDKPDSMALHITVPEPLTVAANGTLRNYTRHGGVDRLHTFDWFISTPINNYAVTLNIAQYSQLEGSYRSINGDVMPITFWVMPENYAKAMRLFPQFSQHLRFFENILGPYPFRFDKYSVVQTAYPGMEHQTVISYGADFQNNRYGFDTLHFHELAHEWFANLVTASDWRDWWLHEGIASYLEALYAESLHGLSAYHEYMSTFRPEIQNRMAVAPRTPQRTREIYGADIYYKGAWVLHTLRYLIGKDALLRSLRRLTYPDPALELVADGRQCHFATTEDFQQIIEDIHGADLDWFFEPYLRNAELPKLQRTYQGDVLSLKWDTRNFDTFKLPVQVSLGSELATIDMSSGYASIAIPNGIVPIVDPAGWILKEDSYQPTTSSLR